MRTRLTEDDPYPDYEHRLDALEAALLQALKELSDYVRRLPQ
jgi:hypothetical protein